MNRIKHFLHIHEIQEKKASDRSEPLRHAAFPGKKMAESGLLAAGIFCALMAAGCGSQNVSSEGTQAQESTEIQTNSESGSTTQNPASHASSGAEETGSGAADGFTTSGKGSEFSSVRSPSVIRDFSGITDGSNVLCDEKGLQVLIEKVYTDGSETAYIDVEVSNSQDAAVEVYSSGIALNSVMTDASLYAGVEPGAKAETTIEIDNLSAMQLFPESIETVQMDLQASDSKTYDTILDTGVKEIVLTQDGKKSDGGTQIAGETQKESVTQAESVAQAESKAMAASETQSGNNTQPENDGGTKIYQDENVEVIAYPEADEDASLSVPVCVISRLKKQSVSLTADQIKADTMDVDGSLVVDNLFPGCRIYTALTVDADEASDIGLESLAGASFRLVAQDSGDYSDAFTTKVIKLPDTAPEETTAGSAVESAPGETAAESAQGESTGNT